MKTFSKYSIRNTEFKNRIVMPPMCMYSADSYGKTKDFHKIHYTTRAMGEVGYIIVEATAVTPNGRISDADLGIWSDEHIEGLKEIVSSCKSYGSKVGLQLAHAGRKCGVDEEITFAPTSYNFSDKYKVPKEMTKEDIKNIINSFKEGARRANEAGFDTIEIHGAHGYLIHEFLSPLSNNRNDEYGGSLDNRVRFLREIISEVKKVWPSNKLITLRVSADDYLEGGINIDMMVDIINIIKDDIDIVHVSSGGLEPADIDVYPGYQLNHSQVIKNKLQMPTISVGMITKIEEVEEVLGNKRADLVALGRELLRNPYWVIQNALNNNIDIKVIEQYDRAVK